MRILILTTKFCHFDGSLWLPSELAIELLRRGHHVTVINLEWSGQAINKSIFLKKFERLKIFNLTAIRNSSPVVSVAFRWIFSSFKIIPFLLKNIATGKRFDLMIGFSPCTSMYAALPLAKYICTDACLIYWDFFPIHNQEISKKAPEKLLPLIKSIESSLINLYDRIGCMSEGNISFFKSYFGSKKSQELFLLPIWTSRLDRHSSALESSKEKQFDNKNAIVFIFGGQLVEGRGVLELCEAVLLANKENKNISLIVCGDGLLSKKIMDYQISYPSIIKYLGSLSRDHYNNVLYSSDVGVVSTVAGVSAPSFPSKSLDYMSCHLPILAAVESASDFGEIIDRNKIGISCEAGDINSMANAILTISSNKEKMKEMGRNGNEYLHKHHSVEHAAALILGEKYV